MPDPTSAYHSYDEFITRWGLKNVKTASDKDGTSSTPNLAAVQMAFDYASSMIDIALRGGVYVVPLDFTDYGGVVSPVVKDWAMVLAYSYLYESRGWEEKDRKANKFKPLLDAIVGQMLQARAGLMQINAAVSPDTGIEPTTVLGRSGICREPDERLTILLEE